MKLSDFEKSEEMYDVMADLIEFIYPITEHKEFNIILDRVAEMSGKAGKDLLGLSIKFGRDLFKLMIKKEFKEEVFGIISVLNKKTVEEVKNQKPIVTIGELKEILTDEEFIKLFFGQK